MRTALQCLLGSAAILVCGARVSTATSNLVPNGGFENGFNSWTFSENPPVWSISTGDAYDGSQCARFTAASPGYYDAEVDSGIFSLSSWCHLRLQRCHQRCQHPRYLRQRRNDFRSAVSEIGSDTGAPVRKLRPAGAPTRSFLGDRDRDIHGKRTNGRLFCSRGPRVRNRFARICGN